MDGDCNVNGSQALESQNCSKKQQPVMPSIKNYPSSTSISALTVVLPTEVNVLNSPPHDDLNIIEATITILLTDVPIVPFTLKALWKEASTAYNPNSKITGLVTKTQDTPTATSSKTHSSTPDMSDVLHASSGVSARQTIVIIAALLASLLLALLCGVLIRRQRQRVLSAQRLTASVISSHESLGSLDDSFDLLAGSRDSIWEQDLQTPTHQGRTNMERLADTLTSRMSTLSQGALSIKTEMRERMSVGSVIAPQMSLPEILTSSHSPLRSSFGLESYVHAQDADLVIQDFILGKGPSGSLRSTTSTTPDLMNQISDMDSVIQKPASAFSRQHSGKSVRTVSSGTQSANSLRSGLSRNLCGDCNTTGRGPQQRLVVCLACGITQHCREKSLNGLLTDSDAGSDTTSLHNSLSRFL
ncbi:hypothetical protein DFS34DRAFT_598693 [Phlyctochytrium arcticum]|nr:hypothetical protein DFS34DRAFT_598693 [Phlyctochytrium arcticum]